MLLYLHAEYKTKDMKNYYLLLIFIIFSAPISVLCQETPTLGEVYDFNVGDVFHYTEQASYGGEGANGGMNSIVISEVIHKEFLENENSVKYKFYKRSFISSSDYPEPYIEERIDSITYSDLDQVISGGVITENPNEFNGRKTIRVENESGNIYSYEWFTIGCGRTYYEFDDSYPYAYSEYEMIVVYYKKGNEEWGEEQIILGINKEDSKSNDFLIFPNPVQNQLNIKTDFSKEYEIHIYNSMGQFIEKHVQSSSNTSIEIEEYLSGIYIVHIVDSKGLSIEKIKFLKS